MLLMPTRQLRHPVTFVVLMKTGDLSEHGYGQQRRALKCKQDSHAAARRRSGKRGRASRKMRKARKERVDAAFGCAPIFLFRRAAAPLRDTSFLRVVETTGSNAPLTGVVRLPDPTSSPRHIVTPSLSAEVTPTGSTAPKCSVRRQRHACLWPQVLPR